METTETEEFEIQLTTKNKDQFELLRSSQVEEMKSIECLFVFF